MPILQADPWGQQIGAALAAFGQTVQQQKNQQLKQRQDEQARQDRLKQQAIANAIAQGQLDVSKTNADIAKGRLGVERRNAGLDENGNPDPRIAAIMAGLGATGMTGENPTPQPQGAPGGFAQTSGYGQTPKMQGDPRLQGVLAGIGAAGQQQTAVDDVARYNRLGQTALQRAEEYTAKANELAAIAPNAPQVRQLRDAATALHADATTYFQQAERAGKEGAAAKTQAEVDAEKAFGANEQNLPADLHQRLGVLRKRLDIERHHGFKNLVAQTQTEIKDIEAELDRQQRQADLEAQRKFMRKIAGQRVQISIDRGGRGGANGTLSDRASAIETRALGASTQREALRILEQAGLPTKERNIVRQDIIDQFRPEPATRDTSGLDAKGKQDYQRDMIIWSTGGMQGPPPDPEDAKYEKKTGSKPTPRPSASPAPAVGSQPRTKVNPANGKTYYLHTDGNYYLTP